MWREWLVLAAVFSCILTGLSLLSPTMSIAQPNQSTDPAINPPPTVVPKQMLCYGNLNFSSTYQNSSVICSQAASGGTFDSPTSCNTGDVMVGLNTQASWENAQVNCSSVCATPSAPQSNCTWQ